jgi:hypothetical protein
MSAARTTVDHDTIRQWVEERGGHPARVQSTGSADDPGLLRIDFPGYSGQGSLEEIDWDTWFDAFDENGLAFLFQDETSDGSVSRFSKLVSRSGAEADSRAHAPARERRR